MTVLAPPSPPAVRSFRAKSLLTVGGMLTTQLASVLLFFLMARQAGPDSFGRLAAALAVVALICDVVDFGANTRLTRDLAAGSDVSALFRRVLTVKAIAGPAVCLSLVLAVAAFDVPDAAALALLAATVPLLLLANLLLVPSRAAGAAGTVAVALIFERLVALAVAVALLATGMSAPIAFGLAIAAGSTTGLLAAWIVCPPALRRPARMSAAAAAEVYWDSRSFGWPSVMSDLRLLDVPLVGLIAGPAVAGIFALPARITGPLGTIATGFSVTVLQHAAAERHRPGARSEFLRGLLAMMTLVSVVLVLTAAAAPQIVDVVLGPQYASAVLPLQLICAGMVLASLNQPMAQLLQALGR